MDLLESAGSIKGVGPKTERELNNCGIFTLMDLLLYFPRDYEKIELGNNSLNSSISDKVMIKCRAAVIKGDFRTRNGKIITTIIFNRGKEKIVAKWFNQPYMKNKFVIGRDYILTGKLDKKSSEITIVNAVADPNCERYISNEKEMALAKTTDNSISDKCISYKVAPKYSLKGTLHNSFLVKTINSILTQVKIKENLPSYVIDQYKFCNLDLAVRNIHNPINLEALAEARRRLKFQELFTFSLKILMLKDYLNRNCEGIPFKIAPELNVLKENLPFKLTNAQSLVVRQILIDEKKRTPMNRLVQGDVGSGKTIVAIIAMFNVVKNGYQCALMAPTEILATQHYNEVQKILNGFNVNVKLLCGSLSAKEKQNVKKELSEGLVDIIIGTHALIEDNVEFENLGMIVTDEQHRFGVMQRSKLFNKGKNVDVLVMTATPIPRTLALYLYGDLDVSIINELPPGRQSIETTYTSKENKSAAYEHALQEISKGRQIYIVCPLVEDNEDLDLSSVEKLYEELKEKYFSNIVIEILHGKMPSKLKDEIMNRFKSGETKAIISTTVIEVGINVPNATMMIIENAERFGLSQLHQLRGRVGRGEHKSYCILIADIKNKITKKRMEIMKKSSDGFFIAEEDLKIRGSGELFGVRQHGVDNLLLSDIVEDMELLKIANAEAKKILKSIDTEDIRIKNEILLKIENSSKFICFN
jgi:ATP-dependent DNA helicase RecG